MAIPTTSGFNVAFPSDEFRNAIKFAMQMGATPDPAQRPTFVFGRGARTYRKDGAVLDPTTVRKDRDGRPLDPTITWEDAPGARVQADCAIEITRADAAELPVGNFRPTKATVTLLDVDYAQVKGCRELVYLGDRYAFGYEPEAPGLFDVGVHMLVFYAIEET